MLTETNLKILFLLLAFIVGAVLGSFSNVVALCLEKSKSLLKKKRSQCPKCRHILGWKDLFPIISFVVLKRTCRYCRKKISWRYFIVEVVDAFLILVFTWSFIRRISIPLLDFSIRQSLEYILYWLLVVGIIQLLLITFLYDLKKKLVSDTVVLLGVVLSVLVVSLFILRESFVYDFLLWPVSSLLSNNSITLGAFYGFLLSAFAPSLFFGALNFFSKGKWIGGGDVKLIFWLGLFLGWPMAWLMLIIAFSIGTLTGLYLIWRKGKGLKTQVPFAPFLAISSYLILVFGEEIYDFYLKLLGF